VSSHTHILAVIKTVEISLTRINKPSQPAPRVLELSWLSHLALSLSRSRVIMAVFDGDVVGGDSALEFAMDALTLAGIGPHHYEERRKKFKVKLTKFAMPAWSAGVEGHWIGRHTPEEVRQGVATTTVGAHAHGRRLTLTLTLQ
jgi:hypothetical protein